MFILMICLPIECEASCGVGWDAVAECPLGILETFDVGPKKLKDVVFSRNEDTFLFSI